MITLAQGLSTFGHHLRPSRLELCTAEDKEVRRSVSVLVTNLVVTTSPPIYYFLYVSRLIGNLPQ